MKLNLIKLSFCCPCLVNTYIVCLCHTNIKKEFYVFLKMNICFKCGFEKNKLFDLVCEEGIVSICSDCFYDTPIAHKSLNSEFSEESKKNIQDIELKEIVNKKFKNSFTESINTNKNLVRNFHWIVMRARRLKKITLSELSKKIAVPEEVLKKIEKGFVPEENFEIIRKLEIYLCIQVLTNEAQKTIQNKKFGFDDVITKSLTIDDLREMKRKKEEEIFEEENEEMENIEELIEIKEEKVERINSSKDLTQQQINDIIFGRRD